VVDQFQAIRQKTDDGARKLLDDDQYGKYQEMRQDERPPWAGRGGGPGGPFGPPGGFAAGGAGGGNNPR
jgi:hypothetical protein